MLPETTKCDGTSLRPSAIQSAPTPLLGETDTSCREEPVGPLLGTLAGVAEDDRNDRTPDLAFGDRISHDAWPAVVQLEDLRATLLDDHRGTWAADNSVSWNWSWPVVSEDTRPAGECTWLPQQGLDPAAASAASSLPSWTPPDSWSSSSSPKWSSAYSRPRPRTERQVDGSADLTATASGRPAGEHSASCQRHDGSDASCADPLSYARPKLPRRS